MKRTYHKTFKGCTCVIYNNQKSHSKKRGHNPPEYTLNELRLWLEKETDFMDLFFKWQSSNYKRNLAPSIDRKDDSKGYSFENITVMTWEENDKKASKIYRGKKHYKFKNKEYYETNSTPRSNFKITCGIHGWDFKNFKEVFSGEKNHSNKKYYYTEVKK